MKQIVVCLNYNNLKRYDLLVILFLVVKLHTMNLVKSKAIY